MVCTIELFHIAPLFALVFAHLSSLSALPKHLVSSLLSVIGLAGGAHMHVEHAIGYTVFDPCLVYAVTFAISVAMLIKASFASKVVK